MHLRPQPLTRKRTGKMPVPPAFHTRSEAWAQGSDIGNLDARRDWGYAPDFVDAMWRMVQASDPSDYVIATGEQHSVRDFCELAFSRAELDWEEHVEIDARYRRPAEVDSLLGDATKARSELGWEPTVGFEELVRIMVDAELKGLDDQLAGKVARYSHEVT